MKTKIYSASVLILIGVVAGCSTRQPARKPLLTTVDPRISRSEEQVLDLFKGLELVHRIHVRDLETAGEPVPAEVRARADKARGAIYSDDEYLAALSAFQKTLERRMDALEAERHFYNAWMMADKKERSQQIKS